MEQQRRTGGQPPRGARGQISVRAPRDQHAFYAERAAELGIPLGSWVVLTLAEVHDFEVPQYVQDELRRAEERRKHEAEQEELPLARSA